jgi:uncharacterized protein
MFEKIIVEQNQHWENKKENIGILREKRDDILRYINDKYIIVITGVRRCGKSFLLRQIKDHLLKNKNNKNILYLNLENPYFDEFRNNVVNLETIYDDYLSLTEAKGKKFIFFDEVQFFKNWQVFLKAKYENKKDKFIITGSNSWLISSEYTSLLSGRTINFELFPFSFKEFLTTKNIKISTKLDLISQEIKIKKLFSEFFQYGGFPEIVLMDDNYKKEEILSNYYRSIVYQDIIPRFKISNAKQTEELSHFLLSNIGKMFSYNKLSKLFDLSDKTIKEYIHYFSQGYLLFELSKYSYSIKKQISNLKKIYAVDVGMSNALGFRFSQDKGRLLENVVFLDLIRNKKEVYYHKEQHECDFVVRKNLKIISAIRVCQELNLENEARELKGLEEAMELYHLNEGTIVTLDQETEINIGDKRVKVVPVWRWLLE